jgi:hypothetical protein
MNKCTYTASRRREVSTTKTYTMLSGVTFESDRPHCPRCGMPWEHELYAPGWSRYDNETRVCSRCCSLEALEVTRDGTLLGMKEPYEGPQYWIGPDPRGVLACLN